MACSVYCKSCMWKDSCLVEVLHKLYSAEAHKVSAEDTFSDRTLVHMDDRGDKAVVGKKLETSMGMSVLWDSCRMHRMTVVMDMLPPAGMPEHGAEGQGVAAVRDMLAGNRTDVVGEEEAADTAGARMTEELLVTQNTDAVLTVLADGLVPEEAAGTGAVGWHTPLVVRSDWEDCTAAGTRAPGNGVQADGIEVRDGACIRHWADASAERMRLEAGNGVSESTKQMAERVVSTASLVRTAGKVQWWHIHLAADIPDLAGMLVQQVTDAEELRDMRVREEEAAGTLMELLSACTMALTDIWVHRVWTEGSSVPDMVADRGQGPAAAAGTTSFWACTGRKTQWTAHIWVWSPRMLVLADSPSEEWASIRTANTRSSRTVAGAGHSQSQSTLTLLRFQSRSRRLEPPRKDLFPATTSHPHSVSQRTRPDWGRAGFVHLLVPERQRTITTIELLTWTRGGLWQLTKRRDR